MEQHVPCMVIAATFDTAQGIDTVPILVALIVGVVCAKGLKRNLVTFKR
jgi:hypothetical protein